MTKLFSGLAAALLASTLAFACSSDDNGRDPGNDTDDAGTSSGNTTRPDGGSSSGGSSSGGSSSGETVQGPTITNATVTPTTFAAGTETKFTITAQFSAPAGLAVNADQQVTGASFAVLIPQGVDQNGVAQPELVQEESSLPSLTGGEVKFVFNFQVTEPNQYGFQLVFTDVNGEEGESEQLLVTAE